MGVLSKLKGAVEKLRRKPSEDLRDYEEIERMRREQEKLRKMKEEIMRKEREKVLKEKWKKEAKKQAEREAYGFFTPSRKAMITKVVKKAVKGAKPTKRKSRKRSNAITIKVEAAPQPRQRREPERLLSGLERFSPRPRRRNRRRGLI